MTHNQIKSAINAAAIGITMATLLQWLPAIAAGLTIIWTCIRIWETVTFQRILEEIKKYLGRS